MATQTTELSYPPLDSQGTYDLIEANVAEADRSGDVSTDLKKALIALLGLSGGGYSLDDLWKRYQLSTSVTGDADVISAGKPPSRTPPAHVGQHPKNFLPRDRIRNDGGTGGFPGGTNDPGNPVAASGTTLHLSFEGGADGDGAVLDYGVNGFPLTQIGSTVTIDDARAKFGSLSVNGTASGTGSAFRIGTDGSTSCLTFPGDFTVEMFVYPTGDGNGGLAGLLTKINTTSRFSAQSAFELAYAPDDGATQLPQLNMLRNEAGSTLQLKTGTETINNNEWSHIAVTRNGTGADNVTLWVNGVASQTGTLDGVIEHAGLNTHVILFASGRNQPTSVYNHQPAGNADEVRVTAGEALYTGAFTPPTAAFPKKTSTHTRPTDENKIVLMCALDAGPNPGALANLEGDDVNERGWDGSSGTEFIATEDNFPWGETSVYLDGGTGENLIVSGSVAVPSFDIGTQPWSLEVFWQPGAATLDIPQDVPIFSIVSGLSDDRAMYLVYDESESDFVLYDSADGASWSERGRWNIAISSDTPYQIAIGRDDSDIVRLYVNGTLVTPDSTVTQTTDIYYEAAQNFYLGWHPDTGISGYYGEAAFRDVRFMIGECGVGADYSAPTGPFQFNYRYLQNHKSLPNLADLVEDATNSPVFDTGRNGSFLLPSPVGGTFLNGNNTNDNIELRHADRTTTYGTPQAAVTHTPLASETTQTRGMDWNWIGTEVIGAKYEEDVITMFTNTGMAYNPKANGVDLTASTDYDVFTNDGWTEPYDVCWSDEGRKLFISGRNGSDAASKLYKYTLTTPYDISTMTLAQEVALTGVRGVEVSGDGTRFIVTRKGTDTIEQYDPSTPWDLSTLGAAVTTLDWTAIRSSSNQTIQSCNWHEPSGTLFVTGLINTVVDTYFYIFR